MAKNNEDVVDLHFLRDEEELAESDDGTKGGGYPRDQPMRGGDDGGDTGTGGGTMPWPSPRKDRLPTIRLDDRMPAVKPPKSGGSKGEK